ncbi:MAG TPA: ribonuclease R [Candidatus Manganitrophaceae bacterium]|nr:ribonuclease R [Candidatus Manganitrophaceae bacterium]
MPPIEKEAILQLLQKKADHPLLLKELMHRLNVSKESRNEVKKLLRKMIQEGEIIRIRSNRYGLPEEMNLVVGRLKGHRDGYGFVIPETEGEPDIYIGAKSMNEAMHGDRVIARIERSKGDGRQEGRIIRILERAHTRIVGRFEKGKDFGFVVSSDKRIVQDLYTTFENSLSAETGDVVVAQIITYPTKSRNPEGKVVKVLGRHDDPRIDTQMVIESYGLTREFPAETLAEAAKASETVTSAMRRGRKDLRALPTVTIDGERARDFDDAISIEKTKKGYRLWVHIADVGHYVPEGSALDREAFRRATSVYFPDAVLPMFPEKLSNGICSLNPNEDRLTMTAEMEFDAEGNRLKYDLYESVIQSDERMTYTAVRQILVDKEPSVMERYEALLPQFEWMRELAMILRRNRFNRGSLDFDLPEPAIILSLTGETIDILREERNVAHQIIEEFMLSANETVAHHMTALELPFLYRIHDPPSPTRILEFHELVKSFGLAFRKTETIHAKALSEILDRVKGRPEERLINQILLRSMKQAKYSAENHGHFGLASEEYTHFTSPIRRYPDLVVHRLLRDTFGRRMTKEEQDAWTGLLPEIAKHTSERERVAMEAEREVIQRKKVNFMADKAGESYRGFISGVAAYGFFVELESFFVEGLVHVSTLHDDYYIYEEKQHALIGEHHRKTFRLGDPVEVRVERVDLVSWRIDFGLVQENLKKEERKKKTGKEESSRRRRRSRR